MSWGVQKGLYSKLAETTSITSRLGSPVEGFANAIYDSQAPQGAVYPYLIISKAAGTKVRAMQTPEAFKREVWLVKAVDRAPFPKLAKEIADAIDAALDGATLNVEGKTVVDLNHVGDVGYPEPSGDQLFHHHGGRYRITLTAP